MIEACRLLQERKVDFRCRLVGDGALRRELSRRIDDAGLSRKVELLGTQPRDRVAALLRESHVGVLASVATASGQREGIPVALMEAMACGLPVVASRQSGIPELVVHEECGILTSPGDSHAIADALSRLARRPDEREAMGRAARERVVQKFSIEANVTTLLTTFRRDEASPR